MPDGSSHGMPNAILKTHAEMARLFSDVPHAIANTVELSNRPTSPCVISGTNSPSTLRLPGNL